MESLARIGWRTVGMILITLCLNGPAAHAEQAATTFGDQSLRGYFVYSLHGAFSAVPVPGVNTAKENHQFAQTGLLHFDGQGQAVGTLTQSFHHATRGGYAQSFDTGADYSVGEDGRFRLMLLSEYSMAPDHELTLDCVIVRPRQEAQCVLIDMVWFSGGDGDEPENVPATGSAHLERQKRPR